MMIVSCPSCSSRYKFDEAKLKGRAAKITCPSCSHKFVVRPEPQQAPPEPPSPEPEAVPDIFNVDFRKLGLAWKVRKGLGLSYEFHSLQQLQDMLQENQV
ncbi:MAG: zinc-ribbon domain-containing protein, partial [Deltaproteobacteria bacterium]|nr:zinc-ribbon domain-containing protein [Deltaproteobacteria bacterium]